MHRLIWSGPVAAILLVAGLFETNVETSKPDDTIATWLAGHGNGIWITHAVASTIGAVLLVVFTHALRVRINADAATGRLMTSLGTMVATMVAVGAAVFAAVPIGRLFEGAPDPDPSVYRYLSATAASLMVIFLTPACAALVGLAGYVMLRTGAAPRWLGITSVALGVVMIPAAFAAPLMVFVLWLLVTGVALGARAPGAAGASIPVPAEA